MVRREPWGEWGAPRECQGLRPATPGAAPGCVSWPLVKLLHYTGYSTELWHCNSFAALRSGRNSVNQQAKDNLQPDKGKGCCSSYKYKVLLPILSEGFCPAIVKPRSASDCPAALSITCSHSHPQFCIVRKAVWRHDRQPTVAVGLHAIQIFPLCIHPGILSPPPPTLPNREYCLGALRRGIWFGGALLLSV